MNTAKKRFHINKQSLIFIVVVLLFALVGLGAFAYINIKEQPALTVKQTSSMSAEQVKAENKDSIVANGTFVDGDKVHQGSGTAKIVETTSGAKLLFENFSTIPGPDLFVYLSPNIAGDSLGEFVSLGRLKSISGNQVYDLPANYKDYKTVVVWCRAFSITFTNAQLTYL